LRGTKNIGEDKRLKKTVLAVGINEKSQEGVKTTTAKDGEPRKEAPRIRPEEEKSAGKRSAGQLGSSSIRGTGRGLDCWKWFFSWKKHKVSGPKIKGCLEQGSK